MNVWTLIIEAFKALVERDLILSERIAELERDNGIEVTEESVTSTELKELVTKMQEHLVPPASVALKED